MEYFSSAHAPDYIVFTINPGLTTFKDLVIIVNNSLDDN